MPGYIFQNISCYCLTSLNTINSPASILFQNISCYCLTYIPVHLVHACIRFQNISCYCLTTLFLLLVCIPMLFQNISCYCLTLSSALESEIFKYEYRSEHDPQKISPLDYTIIYALKHCLEEQLKEVGEDEN